jgi:urease gamma subunit
MEKGLNADTNPAMTIFTLKNVAGWRDGNGIVINNNNITVEADAILDAVRNARRQVIDVNSVESTQISTQSQ